MPEITLEDAMDYGRKTVEAKKEIINLAQSDEIISILYLEIRRLQDELTAVWEHEAGASL